jgi:RHS repeat-associated protein
VQDTVTYTYGDASWGDLLTAYDGVAITYDEMGNPLSDGTWTYTWEHGRQLASMSNGTTTWTYTYDANGMRTSRSNGTDTYTYVYNGSKLMQMKKGLYTLNFTYDANGHPSTVTMNGTTFYYVTNLQGDVMEIRTASGVLVHKYSYDAWGNVISSINSSSRSIVRLNPLLYRGYVYDRDTGLYYLQSRYYDPAIGRFLNADALVSTGQGVLGSNMFTYCLNNPVQRSDPRGDTSIIPLPTLRDYYYMHRAVQNDIKRQYGYEIEVYVVGPRGTGRLDIYDVTTNQYYEVKHSPAAAGWLFDEQMKKYDSSHVAGRLLKKYNNIEGKVTRGQQYIAGKTTYSYWDIFYHTDEDGVIVYDWFVNNERYAKYLAIIAAVVAVAAVEMALGSCGSQLEPIMRVAFAG